MPDKFGKSGLWARMQVHDLHSEPSSGPVQLPAKPPFFKSFHGVFAPVLPEQSQISGRWLVVCDIERPGQARIQFHDIGTQLWKQSRNHSERNPDSSEHPPNRNFKIFKVIAEFQGVPMSTSDVQMFRLGSWSKTHVWSIPSWEIRLWDCRKRLKF